MKTMTLSEYLESQRRLNEMADRLGLEKIENDGTAYSVICFKLLERIEKLEQALERVRGKPLTHWTDMPR